jgi:hypothetical protein
MLGEYMLSVVLGSAVGRGRDRGFPVLTRVVGRRSCLIGVAMNHVCLTFAVLPGQEERARAFMGELEGARRVAYAESERRVGIDKELWFIGVLGDQEVLIGYMESSDFASAMALFSASRNGFDLWFKEHLDTVTGVDLNDPSDIQLPELVSRYEAVRSGV